MSCFKSAFIIGSSLAIAGLAAPFAQAQPAPNEVPVTISAIRANSVNLMTAFTPSMHAAAGCFSEDLVPADDSSMVTICGTAAAPKVIFAQ